MISVSYNPYYDNGIKFLNSNGEKYSDSLEKEIEELTINNNKKLIF